MPPAPPAPLAPPADEQSPPHTGDDLIAAENVPAVSQNDTDSVLSEAQSSTASISSTILEYRKLHGRTYHSDKFTTTYFIPNDEQQLESLDLCHHYLTILLDDQLFLAPLEKDKLHRVLDVGTGTGIWAIEFADRFPNVSVVGTDISPCQPPWVPPNVRFEIDDATLEWTWNANHFDFIYIRFIVGGITDWTGLLKEAFRCCAPGGWVQSVECDVRFRSDDGSTELEPVLASFGDLFEEGGKVLNRPFFVQEPQRQAFDEAGFVETRTVQYKVPVGPWAKDPKLAEVGRFAGAALDNDLQGYTQMIWETVLQRPADEYHVWLAALRKAIRNPKVHSYMVTHIVYGRKPE
ncbi:uncharacterized protein CPUR_06410 [Claviceps purpurea 20.1]|uniref:Methyltransferase n=1 Tax=Claviceps purpurea (strain 20.1) TaxID=1111077 RepID=M1W9N5_CLAP2|nr:uncharacterized protein CPUR_06410 [Claviceps purpurea 20.1]